METRKLYVFGASGHGKVVAELVSNTNCKIEALIDDEPKSDNLGLIPIINAAEIVKPAPDVAMIIAVGNNQIRKNISSRLSDYNFFTSIHKTAFVSPSATVGLGTVVMVQAIINANAKIGNHVIINTAALIEHDCNISDFVHISPKVILAGNVSVGFGSHLGSGAIVIPGIKIGKWCTIGAGTVVINDIPDGATVVGNPGKIIMYNSVIQSPANIEKIWKKKKVIKINREQIKFKTY